jgi:hypothetical protein
MSRAAPIAYRQDEMHDHVEGDVADEHPIHPRGQLCLVQPRGEEDRHDWNKARRRTVSEAIITNVTYH